MKKGQEVYLISLSLVLLASILIYQLYNSPELSPAVTENPPGISNVSDTSINTSRNNNNDVKVASEVKNNIDNSKPNLKKKIVNINTAMLDELLSLDGIGEVKANAIIEYRTKNGSFNSVDELINVSGIGKKTLDKIRNYVTI
ncbi:MAG: helix-hairpin-helix domain-containing protein [Oscillospiraceae bacterium]